MLEEGARAPDFDLRGTDGDEMSRYRLSAQTDHGCVLLAFYNFDFAPVCTTELCTLRDAEWFTFTDDLRVFGISTDGIYAHERFADEYGFNFPLLADTDGSVTDRYGVRYEEEGCPGVPQRSLFLVDEDRQVRYAWATSDARTEPDYNPVQEAVATVRG